ncbi:hypothetical protein [Stenotrophomonas sp. 24(2023)]|uniref:hypothetical protein n=1 Tax=Stenotrophomonas sp. 24(2023) TaxID=3068324 RepID=UPI0027E15716|nr:hypothetical protein [Stenotrophomonas sp. 24(2023)]WMJ69209.1 hypothetical protein Q9R17_18865 [Stenotrophomonas sp. 24(2023)]
MRILFHVIWGTVVFLALLGLATLVIVSTLDSPISAGQLGYKAGQHFFWLLGGTALILLLASRYGWLPGLRRRST